MGSLAPRALKGRVASAWKDKDQWRGVQNEIYKFALPMRNLYDSDGASGSHKGDDKMSGVYDSTAITSTIAFANRIQSDLMPPFTNWVELTPGPFVPDKMKHDIETQLQDAARKGFALLHASNFDLQINEFLLELAAGTGGMLMHEEESRDKPVRFETVPIATVAFDEAPDGGVDGKFRKYELVARNVERTWPDFGKVEGERVQLPAELADKLNDPQKGEEKVKFDECTYWDNDDQVWRYEVLYETSDGGSSKESLVVVSREFNTDPWIVGRWVKVAGEKQGRGPLHFALPDIKTANAVVALVLQNASFAVSGAFVGADDGVLNPSMVVVRPGVVIAAKRPENLRPLEWGGRFDVAQLVLEDMRGNIRRMLFDERLPPMDASVRSATEIVERIKQLQADIGAPFGRLMSEVIQPIWVRLLDIMTNKGVLKTPIRINGLTVNISVTSPLAKQQAMKELEIAMLWIQLLQQLGPEALMLNAKVEDIGEWLAEQLKVDRRIVRNADERSKLQKMAGAMAAQGQQPPGGAPQPQPGAAPQPQQAAPLALAA
jgi:hypothetical protein